MARTGGAAGLAIQRRVSVLPSPYKQQGRRLQLVVFEAQYPARRWAVAALVYASDRTSRCAPQDSGSGWIRCSFPVGLFHSRLHAGLSRRSVCPTMHKAEPYAWSFYILLVTFMGISPGGAKEPFHGDSPIAGHEGPSYAPTGLARLWAGPTGLTPWAIFYCP